MKNQREIYEALLKGETLVHVRWGEVKLNEDGFLNNSCAFLEPQEWSIKPKPVEGWVNVYPHGNSALYATEEEADEYAGGHRLRCVKVREVVE